VLTIHIESPVPLADQIVTGIRGEIARGGLRAGDPLPTVRQLAGDLGINLNTVSRAYRVLETSGLVRTKRGRGTVVVAERDARRAPAGKVRSELAARLGSVLADARLSGLDRRKVEELFARELALLWPKE